MLNILSRFYRKLISFKDTLLSSLRIINLRAKYPGITITLSCSIESNCKIVCTNGNYLKLVNSYVSSGTTIVANGGNIEILDSFIGRNVVIAAKAGIVIGSNCKIAEMVVIRDQDHIWEKKSNYERFLSKKISIGKNVWIANKASILKGVTIGENSIIAAHSLVNKNIESNSINAGMPSRKIKSL